LLIWKAVNEEKLVLFTLSSRQNYLGFIIRGPDPETEDPWIRLILLASGYREAENFKLELTDFYKEVLKEIYETQMKDSDGDEKYAEAALEDFELVITKTDIQNARIFNPIAYESFEPGNSLTPKFTPGPNTPAQEGSIQDEGGE